MESTGSYGCYSIPNWYQNPVLGGGDQIPNKGLDDFMSSGVGACLNTPDIVELLDKFENPIFPKSRDAIKQEMMMVSGGGSGDMFGPMLSGGDPQLQHQQQHQPMSIQTQQPLYQPAQPNMMQYNSQGYSPVTIGYGNATTNNGFERQSPCYLESAEVNLEYMSSPEMAPVSPNRVCPPTDYQYQYEPTDQPIKEEFDEVTFNNLYDIYINESSLAESSTSSGTSSGSQISMAPAPPTTATNFYPQSPASSTYSIDSVHSGGKTFADLDRVQIKQEPIDAIYQQQQQQPHLHQSLVPTVVDEHLFALAAPSTTSTGSRFATPTSSQTTTVAAPVPTGSGPYWQQPQTSQPAATTAAPTTKASTSRRRTANGGGAGHHHQHHFGLVPGQKKQRVTKREKQKMMEANIERYERENKQLMSQIELFEKQINFCKKYLSENVAPYIQKQQQHPSPVHQAIQSLVMQNA